MSKGAKLKKRLVALFIVFALSIESFGAVVSDNDGSAFITKAEFDSLKNDFQSQIDQYNTSIDSKIDGAIAQYLAGIRVSARVALEHAKSNLSYPLKLYYNEKIPVLRQFYTDYKTNNTNYWRPNWTIALVLHVASVSAYTTVTYDAKSNNKWNDFYNGNIEQINGVDKYVIDGIYENYKLKIGISSSILQIASGTGANNSVGMIYFDCNKIGDQYANFAVSWPTSSGKVWSFPTVSQPWSTNYTPFGWGWSGPVTLGTSGYPKSYIYKGGGAFIGGRDNPGTLLWTNSTTWDTTGITEILAQANSGNRIPVLYNGKVKLTNNKYKVFDLLPNRTKGDQWFDGARSGVYDVWMQHVIEPGLFIEPEGFAYTGRTWSNTSLINPGHAVYKVNLTKTHEIVYQSMLEGILATELEKPIELGLININITNSADINKRYLIMSTSPITFDGTPTDELIDNYNYIGLSLSNSGNAVFKKYIELKNGENNIYFKYNGSQPYDKIYYKIVTEKDATDYTIINTEPKLYYWAIE